MNLKVVVVLLGTIIALAALTLFSFGPLARERHTARPRPESLKPVVSAVQGEVTFHNRDSRENYFGITAPREWQAKSGDKLGSYIFTFDHATGSVELMDVPDNSTLELYVLSREEPRLKTTTPGYRRDSYEKQTISGVDAYRLSYLSSSAGVECQTVRTYVTGQDMAGVMTFTVPRVDSSSWTTIDSVITGFRWEN